MIDTQSFPYPEAWGTAQQTYEQVAGGMPWAPDTAALWAPYQQQAGDLSKQLAEQAGLGFGSRYGGGLQRQIADVGMRAGERFGGQMEQMRMQDIANQRTAMLGAAGGLTNLGGRQAFLPGQLAGQAMGLGSAWQQMQQREADMVYQEYLRTHPSYAQLLPIMGQAAYGMPSGPTMYGQGASSQMFDMSQLMAMYSMMGNQYGGATTPAVWA